MHFLINPSEYKDYTNVQKKKFKLKKQIIQYLYFHGSRPATKISKKLKSSIPTINTALNELLEDGIIKEEGLGNSSGGRRPNLFGIEETAFFIMGIDIGRFETRMSIFDTQKNSISGYIKIKFELKKGVNQINEIYNLAQKLIQKTGINKEKLIGVGIAMPGLVDSQTGFNYTYLNENEDISLKKQFEELFQIPVYIENDVKTRTLAEYRNGLAQGTKNTLVLYIDWGVSLGIIINQKLYRGTSGFAGEFGHIPLVENGLLCNCGKQGCLETVASGIALVRLAHEGLKAGKNSILKKNLEKHQELTLSSIVEAANNGDQFSISIISEVGFELGKGISILTQIFNPELLIIGGTLSEANQYLLTPIEQALNHFSLQKLKNKMEIKISKLGPNANILGAVAMVSENIFGNNNSN